MIKELTDALSLLAAENSKISSELNRIKTDCVIIDKTMVTRFVTDFDYIMGVIRKSAGGTQVNWEDLVCELGFHPYDVVNQMKRQLCQNS